MTREDIIRMAREANIKQAIETPHLLLVHELARFAALVAAEEREACAAVCCDMIDAEYKTGKVDHNEMAWTQACANAIQARGEQ